MVIEFDGIIPVQNRTGRVGEIEDHNVVESFPGGQCRANVTGKRLQPSVGGPELWRYEFIDLLHVFAVTVRPGDRFDLRQVQKLSAETEP